jgi:hypothetical protein
MVQFGAAAILCLALTIAHTTEAFSTKTMTPVQVESVKTIAGQSFPVQIHVVVEGKKLDGARLHVSQQRAGRDVTVSITQSPTRAQGRVVPFVERIVLDQGFAPGSYTLRVNDYTTTFEVG